MPGRRLASDESSMEPILGCWAYLVLAVLDLATTSVLLRGFPGLTGEANGFLAGVIAEHGLAGLWTVKLAGAAVAGALYLAVRFRHPADGARRLADLGLVASCVVQGAIVLANLASFVTVAGL